MDAEEVPTHTEGLAEGIRNHPVSRNIVHIGGYAGVCVLQSKGPHSCIKLNCSQYLNMSNLHGSMMVDLFISIQTCQKSKLKRLACFAFESESCKSHQEIFKRRLLLQLAA